MMEEESYTLFVRGLKQEIKTSMGVNVPEGLEDAITWAQRVDLWQSREGAGQEEKIWKKKTKREAKCYFWGTLPVCWWLGGGCTGSRATELWWPVRERRGQGKTERQAAAKATARPKATQMFYCGEGHQMKDCASRSRSLR